MASRTNLNPRVPKEFKKLKKLVDKKKEDCPIINLKNKQDFIKWEAIIMGPKDSEYDGGLFVVDIEIPSKYPFTPPKMKFATKVWHPNISSQTGAICLDILKDEWSPALTIRTALLSLQALLSTPEPDDPQDAEVATQYRNDRESFIFKAQEWTKQYAVEEPQDFSERIAQVMASTGCDDVKARLYLCRYGWNTDTAQKKIAAGEN